MYVLFSLGAAFSHHVKTCRESRREEVAAGHNSRRMLSCMNSYNVDAMGMGKQLTTCISEQMEASRLPGGLWTVRLVKTDHMKTTIVQQTFFRGCVASAGENPVERKTLVRGLRFAQVQEMFDDFREKPTQPEITVPDKIVLRQTGFDDNKPNP